MELCCSCVFKQSGLGGHMILLSVFTLNECTCIFRIIFFYRKPFRHLLTSAFTRTPSHHSPHSSLFPHPFLHIFSSFFHTFSISFTALQLLTLRKLVSTSAETGSYWFSMSCRAGRLKKGFITTFWDGGILFLNFGAVLMWQVGNWFRWRLARLGNWNRCQIWSTGSLEDLVRCCFTWIIIKLDKGSAFC